MGGSKNAGGTTAAGGRIATGGVGTTVAPPTGGKTATGGTTSGTASIGGTYSTGGRTATGGTTSVIMSGGGTTATGGTATGRCSPSPCHSGTCTVSGGTFTCACALNYFGARCESERLKEIELTDPMQVNADGTVVVGYVGSSNPDMYAAQWTASSGFQVLSSESGSVAWAVSGDGVSVFVGSNTGRVSVVRWAGGQQYAMGLPSDSLSSTGSYVGSWAGGSDATGSVMVGCAYDNNGCQAFRWSAEDGFDVLAADPSDATGVSADGSVVVGNRRVGNQDVGFRWTVGTQTFEDLGILPGKLWCRANSVSANGLVIVGSCTDTVDAERMTAVRWVGTTPTELGGLGDSYPPLASTSAVSTNSDGSLIAGYAGGNGSTDSWIWDPLNGVQLLTSILTAAGADMSGWTTMVVTAMSSDGKTVVGWGTRLGVTKGFIARLP